MASTPRSHHVTSIAGNHSSIALYPSDVTFSSTDLVTTLNDDDSLVKARKKEERDFLQGYIIFNNLLAELGLCRGILQDRIINRLTTNPTVAPSKHLYLAKVRKFQVFSFLAESYAGRIRAIDFRSFKYSRIENFEPKSKQDLDFCGFE